MANSRISDLNKITSLDPANDVQGSGMFLIANKKVDCEHIEYRDLKATITDHTVFTTGDQLNILGNKTFKGTVTFEGGHTDGTTGPLTDLAVNLFTTGQTLNNALAALDLDHDADSIKTNLFNSGQLLNDRIIDNETDSVALHDSLVINLFTTGQTLNDKVAANTQGIASLDDDLFATGQNLFSMIDTHSALHEVTTLTASQGVSTPTVSGDLIKSRTEKITVSGQNVFVSGEDTLSIDSFDKFKTSVDEVDMSASTKINLSSPVVTIGEDVFIKGDLFVSGETVTMDVATLSIEDKTIELGASTTGSDGTTATASEANDIAADGAGIIVRSSEGNKTLLWDHSTASWHSNQAVSIEGGLTINNPTSPPSASNSAEGSLGEMRWDDNFFYVKTNNGWRRSLLMDW